MIEYIRQIAKEMGESAAFDKYNKVIDLIAVLREEIDRLDPWDFLQAGRYEFVMLRAQMRSKGDGVFLRSDMPEYEELAERTLKVLDMYGGEGSRAETRSFDFISDADLRAIVERDYKELSLILLPGGAWKSTVVMAGSLSEAILYDIMTSNSAIKSQAMSSNCAPKTKRIDKDGWSLHDLIEVAGDIGVLPPERVKAFDQVLRDYRNFVHPKKEIRTGHPCTEAEGYMAKGALDAICNHLETKP